MDDLHKFRENSTSDNKHTSNNLQVNLVLMYGKQFLCVMVVLLFLGGGFFSLFML